MTTTQSAASAGLSLLAVTQDGCGCGCTGGQDSTSETPNTKEGTMSTQTYAVTGMTCGHCVQAVTSELVDLNEVVDVKVKLVPNGTSTVTVTTEKPLDEAQVTSALAEAGDYRIA